MSMLEDLRPTTKHLVIDLLTEADVDTSHWADFKGDNPSQNPYAYNWSFEQPGKLIVLCLWYDSLGQDGGKIVCRHNIRPHDGRNGGRGKAQWKGRARAFDAHVQRAFSVGIPLRVIICDGKRRDDEEEPTSSKVKLRELDTEPWAVSSYDFATGDFVLTRGELPTSEGDIEQPEFKGFEGELRRRFVLHRRRETQMRKKKILAAKIDNDGTLKCEVTGCGFDFKARYGAIGEDFAHVHHLTPLSEADFNGREVAIKDLAIVCANCHAMIHVGGECRPLDTLIPK